MKRKKEQMIGVIREKYGLDTPKVLSAMLQVPRHKFVSKENQHFAYKDAPILVGYGQTMSQPYTVALMTHLLIGNKQQGTSFRRAGKVLEIGTGSGYQAAVLSKLFKQVYTVEIVPQLAKKAKETLKKLGYKNVHVRRGSGEWGWKEKSPFNAIMITAGVKKVPDKLFDQLKVGGVLVAPVGKGNDKVMTRFRKTSARQVRSKKTLAKQAKMKREEFGTFHFVPFIGEKD